MGTLRGRVADSQTQRPVVYATVMAGGPCVASLEAAPFAETDDEGQFELTLPEGTCSLSVTYQLAQEIREGIKVRSGRDTTADFLLDHSQVRLRRNISRTCPKSGTTPREGAGASQEDVEGIAKAVLERFVTHRNTMTGGMTPPGPVDVLMEVAHPRLKLSPGMLPSGGKETFVARTLEYVNADAKRPKRARARVIRFLSIDSDGKCALVTSGRGSSFDTDLYEKSGSHWSFVRRVAASSID